MKRLNNGLLKFKNNQFSCFIWNKSKRSYINCTSVGSLLLTKCFDVSLQIAKLKRMKFLVVLLGISLHGVYCQGHKPPQLENGVEDDIRKEKNEIEVLMKTNDLLRQNTSKLKKECDENFKVQLDIYNELLKKVKIHHPGVEDLESNVTRLYERDEELEHVIEEVKNYTRMFTLKRKILQEDVTLLTRRQDEYQLCSEFAQEIKFEPIDVNKIGARSLSRDKIAGFVHDRKMTMLRIKKEQQIYRQGELKKYQAYFTGFCNRRLENIKKLIEYLKKYPESDQLEKLKVEQKNLLNIVGEKEETLMKDGENLRKIFHDIKELQRKYDGMVNVATCFEKLSEWHVGKYIEEIDRIIHSKSTKPDETEEHWKSEETGSAKNDNPSGSAPAESSTV